MCYIKKNDKSADYISMANGNICISIKQNQQVSSILVDNFSLYK